MIRQKLHIRMGKRIFVTLILIIFAFGAVATLAVHDVPLPSHLTPKRAEAREISVTPPIGHSSIELTIVGDTMGVIAGEGRNDTIIIEAVVHGLSAPYDNDTGDVNPFGKRVHSPLTVIKVMDKASPKLYEALTSYEEMTVILTYYRPDPADPYIASQQAYYTMTLENATITSIVTTSMDKATPKLAEALPMEEVPFTSRLTEEAPFTYGHMEEVSFTYGKIIWTYEPDSYSAEDDWETPAIP